MTTCSNDYNLFEEVKRIHRSDEHSPTPDRVDVVVANIRPKSCSPLIKELSRLLPLRSQLVPRSVAGDHRSRTTTTTTSVHDEHFDDNEARDFDSIRDDGEKRDDTVTPIDLSHLKRVRRLPADGNDDDTKTSDSSPRRKKIKSLKSEQPRMLQVILGTPVSLYFLLRDSSVCEGNKHDETPMLDHFKARYNVELSIPWLLRAIDRPSVTTDDHDDDDDAEHNTDLVSVPGRGAQSKEELETWNKIWPSVYFHLKTEEHKKELAALEESEQEEMRNGIREAVRDAHLLRTRARRSASPSRDDGSGSRRSPLSGAVMRCPRTGSIVSRASDEILAARLGRPHQTTTTRNPLSTSVLLAIQGVSRTERTAAADKGPRSREFANGQYLCTGYDAYVTREPDVFEAMALVHSRVRRVVFAVPDTARGGLGGTGEANAVHCLPGTNHHYRVFRLATPRRSNDDDDGGRRSDAETSLLALWEACRNLHSEDYEPPETNEISTPKISSKQSSNKV